MSLLACQPQSCQKMMVYSEISQGMMNCNGSSSLILIYFRLWMRDLLCVICANGEKLSKFLAMSASKTLQ